MFCIQVLPPHAQSIHDFLIDKLRVTAVTEARELFDSESDFSVALSRWESLHIEWLGELIIHEESRETVVVVDIDDIRCCEDRSELLLKELCVFWSDTEGDQ